MQVHLSVGWSCRKGSAPPVLFESIPGGAVPPEQYCSTFSLFPAPSDLGGGYGGIEGCGEMHGAGELSAVL